MFENFIWEKIVIVSLKVNFMANTTVNYEVIVFIIGIRIKVLKISILENIPVNIGPIHIKRLIRFSFS